MSVVNSIVGDITKADANIIRDPVLEVEGLGLKYRSRTGFFKRFEHTVLDNIDFTLHRGETLGIVGRNGCGKSSLLRILSGVIRPTSGQVMMAPGTRRSLLALGLGFRPDLSGRENALLSVMLQGEPKSHALTLLEGIREFSELGNFFDRPVKTYSAGMRARLGFATALEAEVDVLLVDETLSVGDAHFKHKAETAILSKLGGEQSVVLVSHAAGQINKLCDRALWLEGGVIKSQGHTASVVEDYHQYIGREEKASEVH